jgi:hypothetical protein
MIFVLDPDPAKFFLIPVDPDPDPQHCTKSFIQSSLMRGEVVQQVEDPEEGGVNHVHTYYYYTPGAGGGSRVGGRACRGSGGGTAPMLVIMASIPMPG